MDLHLIPGATATAEEREAIEAAIADGQRIDPQLTALGKRPSPLRHLLLPALHAVQRRVGWISEGALNHICERLSVAPADAYGVASFYALLSLKRRPPLVVHVCDDLACRVNGAETLCRALEEQIGPPGGAGNEGSATWLRSPCLGQCERAPAAFVQAAGRDARDWTLTNITADVIVRSVRLQADPEVRLKPDTTDTTYGNAPRLLRRAGVVDPESVDDYRSNGGGAALRRALEIGPQAVIREVVDSGLVGRGGAAFPTGRKWEAVARAAVRPHFLICNADESEPGTFKDRVLMEADPFALVEAMTIAGLATGCELGFVYVRGEYPLATVRVADAIDQCRRRNLLGHDVLGSGLSFDIEVRRGGGAYICGEETALFNSIEGLRGEPRNKPPFPTQSGLFGKPTLVNNVETLVNVLDIVLDGGAAFARTGSPDSKGTKLFCLSGCVERAGLYEVPFGTTLRDLVARAGGVRAGRALQAILLGGAAGTFLRPDEIDLPLTFEGVRSAGATIGSGVVMLFDDQADMRDIVGRITRFFRDESCGQCVPCRVGTMRQEEAVHRLASGQPIGSGAAERQLIDDLAQVMRDASICGLGQTASTAVQTAIRKLGLFSQV